MNRFHAHLDVHGLDTSVRFRHTLFAAQPAVLKPDYAKWKLDEPRANVAIAATGRTAGIDHPGFQADGGSLVPEDATICCYAQSDELWTEDHQGARREIVHTTGDATTCSAGDAAGATDGAACSPDSASVVLRPAAVASCCDRASGGC